MPLFPWMQYFGLLILAAVLVTMGLDTKFYYVSWLVGIPWMLLISAAYFIWARMHRHHAKLSSAT